ncbi:SDR family oxidoreductase [Egbenema bharatensis]|uniref:SDR family oxidoreductase n=1 Tax=Egbenema bharatensis TaxID=3463334 RepID=UPI003A852B07
MTSSDRYALITGASSGIGKATALAFAKSGFNLVLSGRSHSRLAAVIDEVSQIGTIAKPLVLDLSDVKQVQVSIQQAIDGLPISVLVNNAGMGYTGELASTPLVEWQRVMDLNLTSVLQCIQAVLPGMRDRQQGTIINVASIAAHNAFAGWGAYSVSKAGLVSLSKILAAEERTHGIRVTVVTPGSVNTPIWDTDTVHADFDRTRMLTPEIVAQSILHTALLPPQAVIDELIVMPSAGAL